MTAAQQLAPWQYFPRQLWRRWRLPTPTTTSHSPPRWRSSFGVLYVLFGLLRMGFIARFFVKPVLDGFIVGLGLYIAIGQLYKVLGAPKPSGNSVQVWANPTTMMPSAPAPCLRQPTR